METLRLRRRDRPSTKSLSIQSSRHSPPRPCFPRHIIPILLIAIQFLIIFYLLTHPVPPLLRLPSPPPSPPPIQNPPLTYDVHVTIYSYDRPRHLLNLLTDLAREADAASLNIGVHVIDDNSYACIFPPIHTNVFSISTSPDPYQTLIEVPLNDSSALPCIASSRFLYVEQFLLRRGWHLYVSKYRHARRRYWHLISVAHALLRPISARHFLFLPDDDRLANNFFAKVLPLWQGIRDSRKMTLMLHVEETRENVSVWTDVKPRHIGGGLVRIGWVESGNFLCNQQFLRFMNWSFPVVPEQRWINNPNISSGVGATLSELIHNAGKHMYRTSRSFVAHVGVSLSKMNAEFREKRGKALLTKYFEDGDDTYRRLLDEAATITASMASQWTRDTALHSAVHSLAHQVDHLNVYLNGYDSVPPYLNAPFVTVLRSQETKSKGDIGDIGKFFWCNDLDAEFHITTDDDIIYPTDYVAKLLEFWNSFSPRVVVGVHGIRIKQDDLTPPSGRRGKGYYASREVWMAVENVSKPVNVHIIGTGTMLYRPSDIGDIDLDAIFRHPNMADVWFGLLAQSRKLPMMIIPHKEGWIRVVPGTTEDSIYERFTRRRHADRMQTEAAKSIGRWQLYEPVSVNS